jgi:hypothetical protein
MRPSWRVVGAITFAVFSVVFTVSIFTGVAISLRDEGTGSIIGYVAFTGGMFAIAAVVLFSRASVLPGERVGGDAFHPKVDLFPSESIERDVVAGYAEGGWRLTRGHLFLTSARVIFVPARIPFVRALSVPGLRRDEPIAIPLDRIAKVDEERYINPLLGLVGLMTPALVFRLLDGSKHAFWTRDRADIIAWLRDRRA